MLDVNSSSRTWEVYEDDSSFENLGVDKYA